VIPLNLKQGDRIECVNMPDDPDPILPGTRGTVAYALPLGDQWQIEVDWDNGRCLYLLVPPDTYRIPQGEETNENDHQKPAA
jgi:hypothetical protein